MRWQNLLCFFSGAGIVFSGIGTALAQQPAAKAFGFQTAASPVMHEIRTFHDYILMPIITAVVLVVLGLLLWCIFRFNSKANPVPSKNSHNTLLEVMWTAVPILILIFIAIPSFKLLYYEYTPPPADLTVKATGYSWYWNYTYPDQGNFAFDSRMLEDKDRKDPILQPRLLAVDNELILPVNKVVHVHVTADPQGVIHAFALPAFGVKIDAVPGRLNEVWFKAEHTGMYYGQCSELCGANHSFMPISIRVVEQAEFDKWVAEAKQKFAAVDAEMNTASLR
jgi:cytochrome c oxidase subunit 2